eukprot:1395418-Amphidinium_carterae.1
MEDSSILPTVIFGPICSTRTQRTGWKVPKQWRICVYLFSVQFSTLPLALCVPEGGALHIVVSFISHALLHCSVFACHIGAA